MKIKSLFHFLGLRGKPRHFSYKVHNVDLENGAIVHYARWLHPHHDESKKTVTPQMVDAYREILREGDFCIDIGAHTGDSTLPVETLRHFMQAQRINATGALTCSELKTNLKNLNK